MARQQQRWCDAAAPGVMTGEGGVEALRALRSVLVCYSVQTNPCGVEMYGKPLVLLLVTAICVAKKRKEYLPLAFAMRASWPTTPPTAVKKRQPR